MTVDGSPTVDPSHTLEATKRLPSKGVLVAIVNYCTADLTIDCLRSLESEISKHPSTQVTVADNASPDGSGAVIADAIEQNGWSAWARLLPLPKNGGFAFGNNEVMRDHARRGERASYVWLLNSDTVVRPGALGNLTDFMDANPTVGVAGSCLEDPDGTQQCSAFRFHTVVSEFESSLSIGIVERLLSSFVVAPPPERRPQPSDWVSGASMMIRATMLERIGLMDENYFLYYEETDFCWRARKTGWACWFVPDSRVVHLIGRSTGMTGPTNRQRRRSPYWFLSRRRYFEKNYGRLQAVAADAALAAGTLLNRTLSATRVRPAVFPDRFLRDLLHHSAIWPGRQQSGSGQ